MNTGFSSYQPYAYALNYYRQASKTSFGNNGSSEDDSEAVNKIVNQVTSHKPKKLAPEESGEKEYLALRAYLAFSYDKQVGTLDFGEYKVKVHNPEIKKLIKKDPTEEDIQKIEEFLTQKGIVSIKMTPTGFTKASDDAEGTGTGYNNIWVRDALWSTLALNNMNREKDGKTIILNLSKYFGTEKQLDRINNVIKNPESIKSRNSNAWSAVHIRFDSETLDDPKNPDGSYQGWGHKQNDALGLFISEMVDEARSGRIKPEDLDDNQWKALILLPLYLKRIEYATFLDSGMWEEEVRTNTSSIGAVTGSLENLKSILFSEEENPNSQIFKEAFFDHLKQFKSNDLNKLCASLDKKNANDIKSYFNKEDLKVNLDEMIDKGYKTVIKQLDAGGEAPFEKDPVINRKADAALLYLLYPTKLNLPPEYKEKILNIVENNLVAESGIKRYKDDAYQCSNYWFASFMNMNSDSRINREVLQPLTKTNSERKNWLAQKQIYIPKNVKNFEAQWFFDSWMSKVYGDLFAETGNKKHYEKQIQYFNRALGQITGKNMISANGKPAKENQLPESYNVAEFVNKTYTVPSPVSPLTWSKACMLLALDQVKKSQELMPND